MNTNKQKSDKLKLVINFAIGFAIGTALVIIASCSAPMTLEQQKLTHNFHVMNGDFYNECMFCSADIQFLLGHTTNKYQWETP